MSVTFSPCVMSGPSLSAFQARYPAGVTDFSDPSIVWPEVDPALNAIWTAIMARGAEESLSLNVHNTGGRLIMETLGFHGARDPETGYYMDHPSGRCDATELRHRVRSALMRGDLDPYLVPRLMDLWDLTVEAEEAGFTHISWA